jgi:hypothetical protein
MQNENREVARSHNPLESYLYTQAKDQMTTMSLGPNRMKMIKQG